MSCGSTVALNCPQKLRGAEETIFIGHGLGPGDMIRVVPSNMSVSVREAFKNKTQYLKAPTVLTHILML